MAGGNKKVQYDIEGNSAGFEKAMEQTVAAAAAGSAAIQAQFGAVGNAFKSVFSHLGAITAVLAGGAAFGKGVETAKELTGEAVKLSKTLGVNVEDASRLNVALRSVGSSADVYTEATNKLVKQVRTNEAALNAMGLKTRDANGQLLNGKQLMENSLQTLATYREGTDRLAAAQVMWGKGSQEAASLLKLNAKVMDEAAKKAEALGLVIGPEQAAKTKAYKEAMDGVKLVLTGLQNQIGQAVMPILTELASYFNDAGPTAVSMMRTAIGTVADVSREVMDVVRMVGGGIVDIFRSLGEYVTGVTGRDIPGGMDIWRNAMTVVHVAALALKGGFIVVFEGIRAVILVVIEYLKTFARIATAAFNLDWDGIQSAWRTGTSNVERVVADSQKRLLDATAANAAKMAALVNGETAPKPTAPAAPKVGGRGFVDPSVKGGAEGDLLKAQFALAKARLEAELTVLREYLAEAQAAYDDAYRRNEITTQQYYDAKLSIEQEALKKSIEVKRAELAEAIRLQGSANIKEAEKLGLKAQEVRINAELTVLTAKLAGSEIRNTREATEALRQKAVAMREIQRAAELQAAQASIEADRISAQRRLAMREITNGQLLQMELQFEARMYQANRARIEKSLEDERDPTRRLAIYADIERLELEHQNRRLAIEKDKAIERSRFEIEAQDAIEHAAEDSLASVARRARTVKEAFMDVVGTIEAELAKLAAKNVFRELFGSVAGGGGNGNWLGSLLRNIGVPSFDVGTPYVPADTFAMVHKGERIIPAKDNAAGNFGGGVTVHQTINFHSSGAIDRRTQQQVATAAWQGAMQAARRNA